VFEVDRLSDVLLIIARNETQMPSSAYSWMIMYKRDVGGAGAAKLAWKLLNVPMEHLHGTWDEEVLQEIEAQIAARDSNIVMSAEDLMLLSLEGVEKLRDMLQGYHVTIVFLHRNRLAHLKSQWLELSKVRALAEHVARVGPILLPKTCCCVVSLL